MPTKKYPLRKKLADANSQIEMLNRFREIDCAEINKLKTQLDVVTKQRDSRLITELGRLIDANAHLTMNVARIVAKETF